MKCSGCVELRAELRAMATRVATDNALLRALVTRVEVLEQARPSPVATDNALLRAILETTEGRAFTCRELLEHATVAPALKAALGRAMLETAVELGNWADRVEHVDGAVILHRVGTSRAGVRWAVRMREVGEVHTPNLADGSLDAQ